MRRIPIPRLMAALLALTLTAAACGDDAAVTAADDRVATTTVTTDGDMAEAAVVDDDGHDQADDPEVVGEVTPTIGIEVFADPGGGVDIAVETTGFVVNPRAASTDHVDGEGHFHLSVDGGEALHFYNHRIHYAGVTEGEVEISVGLSANDHQAYTVDGEPLVVSTVFTVPPHEHGAHSHDEPEPVEFVGPAPALDVEVVKDPGSGWNVFITHSGIDVSGANASGEHVDGEGHFHLYANGQKLARLYGGATHIPALPAGDVEIRVAAFTNDHQPYVVDGAPLEAITTVEVAS